MRSPTSIQRKGHDHGQTTKEQQRDQEAAGHDSQREEGCKESEEERKATHGRVSPPSLRGDSSAEELRPDRLRKRPAEKLKYSRGSSIQGVRFHWRESDQGAKARGRRYAGAWGQGEVRGD